MQSCPQPFEQHFKLALQWLSDEHDSMHNPRVSGSSVGHLLGEIPSKNEMIKWNKTRSF